MHVSSGEVKRTLLARDFVIACCTSPHVHVTHACYRGGGQVGLATAAGANCCWCDDRYHPQDLAHALVPLEELWLPQQECTGAALACGHTFAIKLLLEDATGQVHTALLCHQQWPLN